MAGSDVFSASNAKTGVDGSVFKLTFTVASSIKPPDNRDILRFADPRERSLHLSSRLGWTPCPYYCEKFMNLRILVR